MLKPISWPVPAFPLHFLCLLSLSPATHSALSSTYTQALSAPSENPSVLWNSPPTTTPYCCLDPTLYLFSQFKSVDFRGATSPLAAFSKSQSHCICPGCSRIKSSWGTRGSCCLLSKTKHSLPLQLVLTTCPGWTGASSQEKSILVTVLLSNLLPL